MSYVEQFNYRLISVKLLNFLKHLNVKVIPKKDLKDYGFYVETYNKRGKIVREMYIKDDLDPKEYAFTLLHEAAHVVSFMLKLPHFLNAKNALVKQGEKKRLSKDEKTLLIAFEKQELSVWKFINTALQLNIDERELEKQHRKDVRNFIQAYNKPGGKNNHAKKERKK